MKRRGVLSIAFGVVAALIVAGIGPFYAVPLLIVALPVVFLTMSRATTGSTIAPDFGWVLVAFGVAWLLIFLLSPIVQNSPEAHSFWVGLGVVPVVLAMALAIRRRLNETRDVAHH